MLEVGTKAPDFELPDQNEEMHKLSDYAGKKVILYFYPKDNTAGCTKQACGFSERYPQFTEKGAVILGVSKDSIASHKKFEEKYGLAFTLLADPERKVIEAYDVWKEKKNYELLGKERVNTEAPQMPPNKMFLISGNNSGTGILQNIMDANGTGFICESEADTLSTAIGSDYGHWSDTLRKAFDHDRLSYNRRTDQEYREIKKSYLSVLLSGTPAQVKALIPSAENGLFSRQLFYYMPGIWQWVSQFTTGDIDIEEIFTTIGLDWKKKLDLLKAHGLHTLRLTDEQKQEFDTLFSALFTRSGIANGNEMYSFVARLGVNTCRIMAEVAVLRALESAQPYQLKASSTPLLTPDKEIPDDNIKDGIITRWDVKITPSDFKAVLQLAEPLYCHAMHILSFLPPTEISRRANVERDFFFMKLGTTFTRKQVREQAAVMGIKENTALVWLKRLVDYGDLVHVDGKGNYMIARARVRA